MDINHMYRSLYSFHDYILDMNYYIKCINNQMYYNIIRGN